MTKIQSNNDYNINKCIGRNGDLQWEVHGSGAEYVFLYSLKTRPERVFSTSERVLIPFWTGFFPVLEGFKSRSERLFSRPGRVINPFRTGFFLFRRVLIPFGTPKNPSCIPFKPVLDGLLTRLEGVFSS